jgi:hypothetical protein
MAAPVYTSDLTTILLDMSSTTGWSALGGGSAGLTAPETDYYVQGSNCISKIAWAAATKGMIYNNGAGVTIPSGAALWMWTTHLTPNSLAAEASGGIQVLIGSSASAFKQWYVRGSDTIYYGAPWICAIVDPTITQDATTGSPTATLQYFGAQANLPTTGPSRGYPFGIDAFRYGRTYTFTNGESGNYATFSGALAYNDDISRRYGHLQQGDGIYIARGKLQLGSSGSSVNFVDSNKSILFDRLTKVSSGFNEIEVAGSSSVVSMTGCTISQLLGSPQTATRVKWTTSNDPTVTLTSCVFIDAGTFGFASNTTVTGTTFRRCNQITQNSSTISSCIVDKSNQSVALLSNNPQSISGTTFISAGTGHAIQITTPGTYTFSGNKFSGYGASGTANAAIYNNSGGAVTLNISGGGDTPTVLNGSGASTTVNNTVTLTLTGIKSGSEVRILSSGTATDLAGEETNTTGSFQYSYTYSAGTFIDIVIHHVTDYKYFRIDAYELQSSNASIPISQIPERNYSNP